MSLTFPMKREKNWSRRLLHRSARSRWGEGNNELSVGGETVSYRHEKTFFNPPGLAVLVADDEAEDSVKGKLERLMKLQFERVGVNLRGECVALKSNTGDAGKFKALAEVVKANSDAVPILMGEADVIADALEVLKERRPILYAAHRANAQAMAELAQKYDAPLAVVGENLDEVADLTQKLTDAGLKDLLIDGGCRSIKQALFDQVAIRRLATQQTFRPLGFPSIVFPCEMTDDFLMENVYASLFIAKYAGIIVMSDLRGENLYPLTVERLNIYTDPQRPMKTTEGIYELNKPDGRIAGADYLELLADLLRSVRRNRGQPRSHLAARARYRRIVGTDRLGCRKIRRRYGRRARQEMAASRTKSKPKSWYCLDDTLPY